jgi:hypothetical protein
MHFFGGEHLESRHPAAASRIARSATRQAGRLQSRRKPESGRARQTRKRAFLVFALMSHSAWSMPEMALMKFPSAMKPPR